MELGLFSRCLEQKAVPAGLQGLNVNLEEVVLPTGLQNPGVGLRPWRPIALRKLSWQGLTVLSRETTDMAATSLKESGAFKANVLTCEPSGQPTAMRSSAASRTPSGIQRGR